MSIQRLLTVSYTHLDVYKSQELISINYDITDLKQIEEMLVNERDRAEASDRLKSAFLANICLLYTSYRRTRDS